MVTYCSKYTDDKEVYEERNKQCYSWREGGRGGGEREGGGERDMINTNPVDISDSQDSMELYLMPSFTSYLLRLEMARLYSRQSAVKAK